MLAARRKIYRARELRHRSPELRAIEGWYKLTTCTTSLYREYSDSLGKGFTKLSYSRWLMKVKELSEVEISRIVKLQKESDIDVKISCNFNDILRMSDTKHFFACTLPGHIGGSTPPKICLNPNSAIIYSPDKSGKFKGRAIFHLKNGEIRILRPYGIFKFETLKTFFEGLNFKVNPTTDDTVEFYRKIK